MRVAWFTPLAPDSAIGSFSRHVAERLSQDVDVALWVAGDGPVQPTEIPIARYHADSYDPELLDGFDVKVFNYGDYAPYHQPIYEIGRRHRGIALLHDRVLHHLFADIWLGGDVPAVDVYAERLAAHYGPDAAEQARAALRGEIAAPWQAVDGLVAQPFYEEAIVNAEAAITHSGAHAEEIAAGWLGPVAHLHLPCYPETLARATAAQRPSPRPDGRLRVLTVGNVNPNKRIDRLVEAIADDELLAARLHLDVVGKLDSSAYCDGLHKRVEELGDAVSVELHGAVSDDELHERLASADVFVNLRFPAMESSSASLMEQLAYGRPAVVFDAGFFAEVPAGAVSRVGAGDYGGVARALGELAADPALRERIGVEARRTAATYSVDRYVEDLLALVERAQRWRPALRTFDSVGRTLGSLGVAPDSGLLDRIVDDLGRVFPQLRADGSDRVPARVEPRPIEDGDVAVLGRFLVANDVPVVTATFDPFPMERDTASKLLESRREDRYFGAFAPDGELVALSMLRGWDEGYDVPSFGIVVDHRWHGRGIGRRFTEWTLERARETAAPRVRLSVYEDNEPARRLYERLGFAETERVERDGGRESIVMVLGLAG